MQESLVPRPVLERRLDEALGRRLTAVVATAGFGKSTLLSAWALGVRVCWYTLAPEDAALGTLARGVLDALRVRVPGLPLEIEAAVRGWRGSADDTDENARAQAYAAALCAALDQRLRRDIVLVLDDLHEIGGSPACVRFVEALCRNAPRTLHLLVASRDDVPFAIERLRGAGDVLELGAADLAFSAGETRAIVASVLGEDSLETAELVQTVTSGWPVATRLAVETLAGVPAAERDVAFDRLRRPGGAVYSYLAAEVFQREPASAAALVRVAAPLEGFTPELCEVLGVPDATQVISSLARRGLFLEPQRQAAGWYSLSALVREFAAVHLPLDEAERHAINRRAAEWYESQGYAEAALRCLAAAEDLSSLDGVLRRRGSALLMAGSADDVIAALELLPPSGRDADIERLFGEALQMRGDWDAALAAFARATEGLEGVPASIAWRVGLIHHLRGHIDDALAAYGSGLVDGSEPGEEAVLLAWSASAHWLRGDAATCRRQGQAAFAAATASGDWRALAAAHTALALLAALEGDRSGNDIHYLRALDFAHRSGDVLQTIRIHANRGSHFAEEGDYEAALAELDLAIGLGELGGFASLRALALSNRGDVKFRIGDLDESIADLELSKALYQRAGSQMVAYPVAKLGEVHRERGDSALARVACEEAVALSESAHDIQGLVHGLAALARVLAEVDPDKAAELAQRAVSFGAGMGYVVALLSQGWIALERGDRVAASSAATAAAEFARSRRDKPGLAEALELSGAAAEDASVAVARLEEARAIWGSIGSRLGLAWTELRLAEVSEGSAANELADRAARRFRELGARRGAAAAERFLAELDRRARPAVEIRTLGGFAVLRAGEPVPLAEWQSKKARDLLKILVSRRGHPVTREQLMEALWPDQSPDKLGGRLSVALTTVRSILDPGKSFDREHFVVGDKGTLRLDLAHVEVDVERFLSDAESALALRREAPSPEANERLTLAEARYTGDFLEEDPYEDWPVPLREEALATYIAVTRALAEHAGAAADAAAATKFFLRILERDPYDEHAHIGLVSALAAAGRHGEAQRFYRSYCAGMERIGVEAASFPALSRR